MYFYFNMYFYFKRIKTVIYKLNKYEGFSYFGVGRGCYIKNHHRHPLST